MSKPASWTSRPGNGPRQRLVLLLLALAAVAAALSWLWWGSDPNPVSIPTANGKKATGAAPVAAGAASADVLAPPVDSVGSGRTGAAIDEPIGGAVAPKLCLIVKDAETLTPVAGVAVHYMLRRIAWQQLTDQDRLAVSKGDWLDRCRDFGETQTSNATGCIWIERSSYVGAAAADRTRYGQLTLAAEQLKEPGPFVLLLHKGARPEVRIVDSLGASLPFFPVMLRPLRGGQVVADVPPRRRSAGADGSWRIRDRQALIEQCWREPAEAPFDGVEVRLGIPLPALAGDGPAVAILFAAPPTTPLLLVAPDTGSVIVRSRDPLGRPVGRYGDHNLVDTETSAGFGGDVPIAGGSGTKFLYVSLGRMLLARAYVDGLAFDATENEFVGPRVRGQTIEVTLTAVVEGIALSGTLIGAKGAPLAATSFRLQLAAGDLREAPHTTTEDDGSFLIPASSEFEGRHLDLAFIQLVAGAYTKHERHLDRGATVAVGQLQQGLNEVGTIQIDALPLIAAGRTIVDGIAATAEVYAEWLPVEGGPDNWDRLRGTIIETAQDGTFTLRGVAPRARSYRLFGYLPAAILPPSYTVFGVGQTNIELAVSQGGEILADVVVDPDIAAEDIVCRLTPMLRTKKALDSLDYMWRSPYGRRQPADEQGAPAQWRWQGIEPGDYELQVLAAGCHQPLVTLSNLEVVAGGVCSDPRLRPIDLRSRLAKVQVTITSASGDPLGVPAFVHAAATPSVAVKSKDGVAQVVGEPPMELAVRATGHYPEWLRNVKEPRTVTLRPLPEVVIEIAPVAIPSGWRAFVRASVQPKTVTAKVFKSWGPDSLKSLLTVAQSVQIGERIDLKIRAQEGAAISLRAYVERIDNADEQHAIDLGVRADVLASPAAKSRSHLKVSAAEIQAATER